MRSTALPAELGPVKAASLTGARPLLPRAGEGDPRVSEGRMRGVERKRDGFGRQGRKRPRGDPPHPAALRAATFSRERGKGAP